ncbi:MULTISPECIES: sensor histidine kinase [Actinoplanes]|uniref:sensor histidine kinase n=1 Tax=Actinoplanes TaxID=1865 RepID=UPI0005F2EEB3|nr:MULTISPECIES: sensor histidine kinase [Actinoplanes]
MSAVRAWAYALLFPVALLAAVLMPFGHEVVLTVAAGLSLLLPVPLLRRTPLAGLLLILVSGIGVLFVAGEDGLAQVATYVLFVALDIVVGYVAARERRQRSAPAAALVAVVQIAMALFASRSDVLTMITIEVLAVITAWVIGDSLRQRRRYAATQRRQAEDRAVQAERLRIARELHDMIAHSIGVISVQAGMGRRVIDTQPEAARDALAAIEETSRDTAASLRRMLGTLRRHDTGAGPAPLDPAPGLADLDGLVTRTAQAGVEVDLRWAGERTPLPPDIDLSAFRIIQEAVTNVIRHSGAGHCAVLVDRGPTTLAVTVTDDGRGGSADGPGYGIAGMRERISLLDGVFTAGPGPSGGFRVTASIPLPTLERIA